MNVFTVVQLLTFFLFFILFLFSNIFATMIRIYSNSRPVVNVNIVTIINLYLVEICNISVALMSVPQIWVSLVSPFPFTLAYVFGLLTAYLGYIGEGLACIIGIIKMLIVLQVKCKNSKEM